MKRTGPACPTPCSQGRKEGEGGSQVQEQSAISFMQCTTGRGVFVVCTVTKTREATRQRCRVKAGASRSRKAGECRLAMCNVGSGARCRAQGARWQKGDTR